MLSTVLAPPFFPSPPLPLQNKQINSFESFYVTLLPFSKMSVLLVAPSWVRSRRRPLWVLALRESCQNYVRSIILISLKTLCMAYNSWSSLMTPFHWKTNPKQNLTYNWQIKAETNLIFAFQTWRGNNSIKWLGWISMLSNKHLRTCTNTGAACCKWWVYVKYHLVKFHSKRWRVHLSCHSLGLHSLLLSFS